VTGDLFRALVADFGHRLGIANLEPNASGRLELTIERAGRLQMEAAEGTILVTLARAWPRHSERTALAALSLCHWRENHPWPIHAGALGEEWLSFTVCVPARELDLPALERQIDFLSGLLDAAEKAG
jgi:type III secretion system chaperone SycN